MNPSLQSNKANCCVFRLVKDETGVICTYNQESWLEQPLLKSIDPYLARSSCFEPSGSFCEFHVYNYQGAALSHLVLRRIGSSALLRSSGDGRHRGPLWPAKGYHICCCNDNNGAQPNLLLFHWLDKWTFVIHSFLQHASTRLHA